MKKALLVIDVQNEYFDGKLPIEYPENSFENIIMAIDSANQKNIPVILIQHTSSDEYSFTFKKGSKEWEIHEDVLKRDYDIIIEKNLPGSFTGTQLEAYLKENNVENVAICGFMTHMCCDTTARQAMQLGFDVEFLDDATGTLDLSNYSGDISAEELHKAILIVQAMKFSDVISTEDWIRTLEL
ncbi:MAG: cysteine hydrolase family protein [Methanobacteriaceae archaeon]|nr:cysteine hydrolase family protein [Methanobacteriaceae archaeon]MDP2836055.1 cysteine hydrolase family protein [Methanobacteriaceae archaeon]MDP3035485.1 cysteine hydrolase family protein [Methanobacteriaceae archaeon]MDP3485418.1 cysteine hydrolase family protein [Methanobacteriaceae archaeon]MDP3623137.1 cysteine hydrolase family protein [Methanobacteriaceae archaeon]